MTNAPHILRRYVIDRAAGRMPRPEWAFFAPDIGAWVRAEATAAQRHEHHRRIRQQGRPWCDVMGHRTGVRDDTVLQIYFLTIEPDEWRHLAIAVERSPKKCLREWRAAGARLIAAVGGSAGLSGTTALGPLDDWPTSRGTGPRSMLPR